MGNFDQFILKMRDVYFDEFKYSVNESEKNDKKKNKEKNKKEE